MMTGLRRFLRRAAGLFGRARLEREMDDEMRFHVDMEAEELIRTEGLEPAEARRRARIAFGGVEQMKERARDARRIRWLEDFAQDAKQALRGMRRARGFTAVAVITLALGIGATTAMYGIVDGVMLKPLPYPDSDRLVSIWSRFVPESGFDFPQFPLSPPEYFDYLEQGEAIADAAAFEGYPATVFQADGAPIAVRGVRGTANFFDVLGVRPHLGRTFAAAGPTSDGPDAIVLSHGLWQRAFGADPAIVGRTMRVNGEALTVIGVMPAGFAFPTPEIELWTRTDLTGDNRTNRSAHFLQSVGRLAPGVDIDGARAEMEALMASWEAEFPDVHRGHFLFLRPLVDDVVGDAEPALLALLGAVGLLLLIVCANVANLLLARGQTRQRELSVRSALGAARGRLVRQFLAEGAILSAVGALVGVGIAYLAIDLTLTFGSQSIPRAESVAVDGRVLLFMAAVGLFTAVVFAVAPSLALDAARPQRALGEDTRSATGGGRGVRIRHALVTAQIALAVIVVLGAGLLIRSYAALTAVDPGFRAENALVAELSPSPGEYPTSDAVIGFYEGVVERLGALPGARSAAVVSTLPLGGGASNIDFRIEGTPAPAPGEPAQSGDLIIADPGYTGAFGIDLVEGRYFEPLDRRDALPVVVVNRRLADTFWPGESAVGRRMRIASSDEAPWLTIVGVIDDVQFRTLAEDVRPAWYLPLAQFPASPGLGARSFKVVVRADGDPSVLAAPMRDVIRETDPAMPVIRMRAMERIVAESVAGPRFTMLVFGAFGLVALALGAVGVYGVLAYSVARRTREFGIRIALGAGVVELARLVLGRTAMLVGIGLATGIGVALLAGGLLRHLLFGVRPTDPLTIAAVAAAVALTALGASVVPVLRAVRADPGAALRAE